MSGQLPAFLNGSQLVVRINGKNCALAQAISFSDNVSHQAVGGLGAMSPYALEPLQYMAQGSMVITRWSSVLRNSAINKSPADLPSTIDPLSSASSVLDGRDGNSFLDNVSFNPRALLISSSFDIDVYQKQTPTIDGAAPYSVSAYTLKRRYQLQNCRFGTYGFSFAPGTLLQENVTFYCLAVIEDNVETNNTSIVYE